jgi:DNA-binding transcriptional LysR family regulator
MSLLIHLPVIAAVARHRSFAAAAAELGLGASAVSHAVRVVERELGQPLFARTTRSVALTEAGAQFLARALPALDAIDEAASELRAARGQVSGVLRINAPRIAGPMALRALMAQLAARHPQLTVEVTSDDSLVDIVAGGYDAGVRLGEMIAEDMVAIRLTPPFKAIAVASPAYLQRAGTPHTLADLRKHNCIGYRLLRRGAVYAWEFLDKKATVAVAVDGSCRVSDPLFALDLALDGVGIAYLFEPLARPYIDSGALQWLLPSHALPEPGLFLYFPCRAQQAPKLRALIDLIQAR